MNETPPNKPGQTSALQGRWIARWRLLKRRARRGLSLFLSQFQTRIGRWGRVWFIGLLVGIAGGYAGVAFHYAIAGLTQLSFGAPEAELATAAAQLDRVRLLIIPLLGGILVGLLIWFGRTYAGLSEARLFGVADIIEARALRGGKVSAKATILSSLGSVLALGMGSATGREGPAAFLGAGVGSWLAERFRVSERDRRTLLACGVAAAVAASFNAPIAGALFALEVVLGHYALRAIAPISIAAVAGTLISRLHDASVNVFAMPFHAPRGVLDFALAACFGVIAALIAIAFMRALLSSQKGFNTLRERSGLPVYTLPAIAGAGVGLIALIRPEVLGVGYEATAHALRGDYSFGVLIAIAVAKFAAAVLCFGARFGVGVFSPSVMLGAVSGAAFGALVSGFGNASGESLFALIGMGAVAGAVLGAPLSTPLIVFEMTGSYETAVALLVSVSLATVITQSVMGGNIFQLQIESRGYQLADGPQRIILQTTRVAEIMTPLERLQKESVLADPFLYEDDTLGKALGMMEAERIDGAPVRKRGDDRAVGYLSRADALIAYNQRLVAAHEERAR